MSLGGVAASIRSLLDRECNFEVKVLSTNELDEEHEDLVSVYVYRVDIDPSRRHIELPSGESPPRGDTGPRRPTDRFLALDVRFLLSVWSSEAAKAHDALEECIEVLERHAIMSGRLLHPDYRWHPSTELKVSIDSLKTEELMRLWDSLEVAYRLTVPYLARTVPVSGPRASGHEPVTARQVEASPEVKTSHAH